MKRIGYTTGVFDLFHIGHLNILERAKASCDFLIVGVTTDELCESTKGRRPVIPYEERVAIIQALRVVDRVVPQDRMDKVQAVRELACNIVFVGDDWKGTQKWNQLEEQFAKHGVRVVYFPYTTTTSSTLIRDYLQAELASRQAVP